MGDTDLASSANDDGPGRKSWRARAALIVGQAFADRVYRGTDDVTAHEGEFLLTLQLASLALAVDAPWGTGLAVLVPGVRIRNERLFQTTDESGPGDVELKLRQDLRALLPDNWPRLSVALGAVAPTGYYLQAAPGSAIVGAAVDVVDKELSIGRGAWWLQTDAEVAGNVNDNMGLHASVGLRKAVSEAPDGFGWGSELRYGVGVRYSFVPRWLTAIVSGEVQQRLRSTEVYQGERRTFANAGGVWLNVTPALVSAPLDWLTVSASLRVPLYRDVKGLQAVQDPSVFLSIGGNLAFGADVASQAAGTRSAGTEPRPAAPLAPPAPLGAAPDTPEIAALLVAGHVTVVDYWATWCAPCLKLTAELEQFSKENAAMAFAVAKVDASDWDAAQWQKFLPDAAGLPVLDVFGADGRRIARLYGEEVFRFRAALPKLAPKP